MDRLVARLNIDHYRQMLACEIDACQRAVVQKLLVEEESKLAVLDAVLRKRWLERD